MANQQERLASLEFIAGLVVGEGCFTFNIDKRTPRAVLHPKFALFMCDKETVELVYESLKEHELPCYFYTRQKTGNARTQYGIMVHGVKRVHRFAGALLPYLTGDKRQAAEIMHGFCAHRLSLDPKAGYSDKDVEFYRRLREVNGNSTVNRTRLEDLPRILRDFTPSPSTDEGEDRVRAHVRA